MLRSKIVKLGLIRRGGEFEPFAERLHGRVNVFVFGLPLVGLAAALFFTGAAGSANAAAVRAHQGNRVKSPGRVARLTSVTQSAEDTGSESRAEAIVQNTADILWDFSGDYFHRGWHPQTIRLCHVVEQLDPHFVEAYSNAGWLEWSLGDSAAAIRDVKEGVARNPNNASAYGYAGDCFHLWLKRPDDAIPYYIRAEDFFADAPWYVDGSLAHAAEKAGDYDRAAVAWRTARLKTLDMPVERDTVDANLKRVMVRIEAVSGPATSTMGSAESGKTTAE
jgi:tetratricopeptide (TPR) repeat protein